MNTQDTQDIVKRFFVALDRLKEEKVIRGRQTFTNLHGINRRNLYTLEKHPESNIFQAAWLTYLVREYGVSSRWLLTGEGGFYGKK